MGGPTGEGSPPGRGLVVPAAHGPPVDPDVHPQAVVAILRHAQLPVTTEVHARSSSRATQEALERLDEFLV